MTELPIEFTNRMKSMLGDEFPAFLSSYSMPPKKGLRVNTLRTDLDSFSINCIPKLPPLTASEILPEGFIINNTDSHKALSCHPYHLAGAYYLQEPSAMSVAAELSNYDFTEHTLVLDMCAAPGGKTGAVAAYMRGRGIIVANEIVPSRAKELIRNLERLGVTNSVVTNLSPDKIAASMSDAFDIVIVDAPCSGEGMFRKNPQAIIEWSAEHVRSCAVRQEAIVKSAADCLKPGGLLIYSTCTFSEEENEGVAEKLTSSGSFEVLRSKRLYPHNSDGEGHFVCVLKKSDNAHFFQSDCRLAKQFPRKTKSSPQAAYKPCSYDEYADFVKSTFSTPLKTPTYSNASGRIIHATQAMMEIASTLSCISCGVHAGFMKHSFEPSHTLFMSSGIKCRSSLDFNPDSEDLRLFLQGEVIRNDKYNLNRGYYLISCDGFPLGFCKAVDNELKNKLPSALRLRN